MKSLNLAVKREYFEKIDSGEKVFEYRLCNEYWNKRIPLRCYDRVIITLGYPKRGDKERTIEFVYRGFEIHTITHPHFGDKPVTVYAIRLKERL